VAGVADLTVSTGSVSVMGHVVEAGRTIRLTSDERDGHALLIEAAGGGTATATLRGLATGGVGAFR